MGTSRAAELARLCEWGWEAVRSISSGWTQRLTAERRLQQPAPAPSARAGPAGVASRRLTSGGATRRHARSGSLYVAKVAGRGYSGMSYRAGGPRIDHQSVKPPVVWGLRDVTLRTRRRLRLVCRTQGTPLPAVLWYKDGVRITASRRVRILHNRKKSALVIGRVKPSDGGRYECKAVSVIGRQDSASAAVSVQADARQDNTTTLWPLVGTGCFFDAYCLNGGTCTYYDTVGELVCQCAEGYKGQRCENKDVINRGSMYRPLSYFCKLGISNSYYC